MRISDWSSDVCSSDLHIERVVERGDGGDRRQRLARREYLARLAVRREIAGEDLAVVLNAKLPGEREDIVGAPNLVERVGLGNAELEGDEVGDLVPARDQQLRRIQQDLLALVAGELGLIARGDLEGLAGVRRGAGRDGADPFVGVRIAHLAADLGVAPDPRESQGFGAYERGGGTGGGHQGTT